MALDKQMDLFQEGGMIDEGGTTDPVSGNDVPVGSLQEEVRDDIPAQLSEGEFVMPADVVRYHGLDKMMALRDEAKMGLQRMEAMGQMGNADEATLPSDVPFGLEDLDIAEDPREMQVGGFVPAAPQFTPGGVQQSQFQNYAPQFTPYQMPQYTTPDFSAYQPPQQAFTPMAPTQAPSFTQFVRPKTATYVNADGNEIQIPVGEDGTPLIPVPPGYTLKSDTPVTTDPTTDPAQQQTQVASTQTQQEDPSYISPEEQARQEQRSKEIKARKEAAKKLGYTKEANPLEGLLGALIPGASLFGVGGNQEVGTIMPDGTISDGQGNTFDPITGQQMGGKGFLGLGKSEAEKFGLSDQIPESSLAGLRSEAGEQSIKDLIASIPPTEEKAPTDVGVETARVTEEGTAADVATKQAAAGQIRESLPTRTDSARNRRNDLVAQTYEALIAGNVPGDLALTAAKQAVDEGTVNAEVASLFGDIGSALTDASLAGRSLAGADDAVPSGVAAAIRESQQPRAATTTKKPRVDTRVVQDEMSRLQDTYEREAFGTTRKTAAIQSKISEAKSKDPSQYAKDVRAGKYDDDFAALDTAREERNLQRNTGKNKAGTDIRGQYGDDVAKKVRDDQGTVGSVDTKTGQISYDSSHDWSKPTQTNINSVTSTKAEETSDSRDDKIICTEMYRQTQLDDWKRAIKIWGVYEKKYLTPYHQTGYHYLFKPWVRGMQTSTILTSVGAYLAKARTQHLKYIMTKGKSKDSFIGNVWCKIIHPIVYITGRMLSWQKK